MTTAALARRMAMAALAAVLALGAAAMTARADTLLVADKSGFDVLLINPATGKEVAKLPTQHGPHEIAVSPDGRTAYVSNFGRWGVGAKQHDEPGNTITVLDLAHRRVKATWTLGDNHKPHGMVVSRDGKTVWLALEQPASVIALNAATGKIEHQWKTGQVRSHMVASKDDQKLYISNIVSGTESVLDLASGKMKIIPTGKGSEGNAISPDGSEVWVAVREENKIAVISTATDTVTAKFDSGAQGPVRLAFAPDGKQAWVSNMADSHVTAFDARSRKLLGSVKVSPVCQGLVFSPDGRHLYVADSESNQVTEIDTATRKVEKVLPGGDEPDGIAWAHGR
jgi:YVTN family beta-propeller protein